MKNKLSLSDKIYISGANGMVGAIVRSLKRHGYGKKVNKGVTLPKRKELDLLDSQKLNNWFRKFTFNSNKCSSKSWRYTR